MLGTVTPTPGQKDPWKNATWAQPSVFPFVGASNRAALRELVHSTQGDTCERMVTIAARAPTTRRTHDCLVAMFLSPFTKMRNKGTEEEHGVPRLAAQARLAIT